MSDSGFIHNYKDIESIIDQNFKRALFDPERRLYGHSKGT